MDRCWTRSRRLLHRPRSYLASCVPAPALVKVREARPVPRSRDPLFYRYWVGDSTPEVEVEGICERWEGGGSQDDEKTTA